MSVRERFWRWFDRLARADFMGTLLGYVVDWKGWLISSVAGGGGSMTFIWAAIDGRSPLDVWVSAVVIVAALAVIVFVLVSFAEKLRDYRLQLVGADAPSGDAALVSAQAALVKHQQLREKQNDPTRRPSEFYPDWRIAELFSYLRADVLEQTDSLGVWEGVGDKIRDKASVGQLRFWGRAFDRSSLAFGGKAPLEEIPASYWRQAQFAFTFFYTDDQDTHTYPNPGSAGISEFTDLQVNRAQALSVWPEPLDGPKASLLDAARRAYSETQGSQWAVLVEKAAARGEAYQFDVLHSYAAAIVKHSVIWGCKPPSDKTTPQDLTAYRLTPHNSGLVARALIGPSIIENLMVSQSDLEAFIAKVKKFPTEPI